MKQIYWTLDDDHQVVPATIEEWSALFGGDKSKRFVEQTQLDDGTLVSTVFLGIDHNFGAAGPPLIFETMVFPDADHGSWTESYCERYSTWDEAVAGHKATLARLIVERYKATR